MLSTPNNYYEININLIFSNDPDPIDYMEKDLKVKQKPNYY